MTKPQKTTEKKTQKTAAPTPMMAQYLEIKAANRDSMLFYRMGDFYELFFEDAENASRALGIQLTKRGQYNGKDVPMAGVPVHSANDYLQRLIRAGFRVAVCEQLEEPSEAKKRGAKAVVKRDVVRLVTPGTLTEDTLLDATKNNFLTAVFCAVHTGANDNMSYALASIDISTGEFLTSQISRTDLAGEILRLHPGEILAPDSLLTDELLKNAADQIKVPITPTPDAHYSSTSGAHDLKKALQVSVLDGYGHFSREELSAVGSLLKYIELTQIGKKPILRAPKRQGPDSVLVIDAATRINLELTRTTSGDKKGSLLATLDRTVTGGGARTLSSYLSSPLRDVSAIHRRLDCVSYLFEIRQIRSAVRKSLKGAPDMARALSRLTLGRGGPRDLGVVLHALQIAHQIAQHFEQPTDLAGPPDLLAETIACLMQADCEVLQLLQNALADDLPVLKRDGGFIRNGYDAELDKARLLRDESRQIIATLQTRYADETGVKSLKIRHNNMLGYFIETTANTAKPLFEPPLDQTFIHRQTLANAVRFTTVELGDIESQITTAAERALAIEQDIFADLLHQIVAVEAMLIEVSDALAEIDVYCALADLADEQNYVRPHVDDSTDFKILGGRHPVVDIALQNDKDSPFIANDCTLSQHPYLDDTQPRSDDRQTQASGRLWIITGPNMAGKSTFLRQNALITVLAQMGSFVPAQSAHIGVVDRLFSRVGASDDLARGRSTFMVEMVETAAILNQATPKSLVILDEIGRGTATFDGLSIAWATVEYLHDICQSRALFATHYHELTALAGQLDQAVNATTDVKDWQEKIIFLYKIKPGAADRSYGIQVAKLAGLPAQVITRAHQVLKLLEDQDKKEGKQSLIDDLPLFSASRPQAMAPSEVSSSPETQKLIDELQRINPDMLSPKDALDVLYTLKSLTP